MKCRQKLLSSFSAILQEDLKLNKEIVEIVSEIMDVSACYLLKAVDKVFSSVVNVGREVDWKRLLPEIELSAFTKKGLTNLKDLYAFSLSTQVNSSLLLPFNSGQFQYIFLFFRDTSEFDEIDEQYANEIKADLVNSDLQVAEKEVSEKLRIGSMLEFQISEPRTFEFIEILSNFKQKLRQLCEIDSCSVYIANQKERNLWTKNTHSSDALIFPIIEDSIMGYSYINQTTVLYPESKISFSDLSHYKDKSIACLPILENKLKNPVIGVILITKSSTFEEFELWIAKKYSETLGSILYVRFLEVIGKNKALDLDSYGNQLDVPYENLFLQINKSTSLSRKSIQESGQNKKLPEIEQTLAMVLKCQNVSILNTDAAKFSEEIMNAIEEAEFQQSYQYLPVINGDRSKSFLVIGLEADIVACFHNFQNTLDENDLKNIQTLTRLLYSAKPFHSIHNKVIEEARHESLIYKWTSQLILISNLNLHKLLTCKSVIYKLESKNDITTLCHMALDIICALTNSLGAFIIIQEDISFVKFQNKEIYQVSEEEINLFEECAHSKAVIKQKKNRVEENCIIIPIVFNEVIGLISVFDKREETNREFTKFSIDDVKVLQEFAKTLAQAFAQYPSCSELSLQILSQYLRQSAIQYKPQSLFLAMRKAAQRIFDCDKINLFLLNAENLILVTQGIEDQISKGFSMALQGSIFSSAVKTGKSEIVNDVYNDSRFNPEIDKITGYKTSNMLALPIRNSLGKVFCLLECINKRTGIFHEKDIENSVKICQVFERVLDNWELMKKNIEEIFRLKGISNSVASYILVFNHERKLSYTNKPIEDVFGVSENEVLGIDFSLWLNLNKDLKEDIEKVYENPSLKLRRTSQKIKPARLHKVASFEFTILEDKKKAKGVFEYRVVQLQDISSDIFSGVVLILEDNSSIEALHQEFKEVQDQLRAITSPVTTETGLQKCIRELNFIVSKVDSQDTRDQIVDVVERLKAGGLKEPKFVLMNADKQEFETVNSIFYMDSVNYNTKLESSSPRKYSVNDLAEIIPLPSLRDWNLNSFAIENKYNYIYSMLSDFNAIKEYQINDEVLYNFILRVKGECNKRKNPYHNFNHCFSVMHSLYMLLSSTCAVSFFTPLDIFGLLIAAICHDIDHTGRTNMFEVNSKSQLALRYNDKSVLEQHHAAVTFEILMDEDSNIFQGLTSEMSRDIRKLIITAIMGTDMSKHYSILTNINARCNDIIDNPIGTITKDKENFAQFLLHSADLSHPTKHYRTYEMWSLLVCQEFSDQHLEEIAKNLPITEFMKDLDNPKVYYANEIGFLNYVVRPLWSCVNNLLKPDTEFLVETLEINIEIMKKKLEEWKTVES